MPPPLRSDLKKSDKLTSKPKFLDVYSKYVPKESTTQRKQFKIYQNKLPTNDKYLRTEPD